MPGSEPTGARQRGVLLVVSAATGLLLLDVTVVNVALAAIRDDLGAGFDALQWVIDAYALALATTVLAAGALADRWGRRRMFATGLAGFAVTSAACAAAPSPLVLDLARAAQGVAGAAVFAASLAVLADAFRGPARARALGVWGAVTGAALALGPVVGGALVDGPGWRWAFAINVPVCLLLLAGTARWLHESRDPAARRVDWAGAALFSGASFLLVLGLLRGDADGWRDVAWMFAAGGALLGAFVALERRLRDPMLDPVLFRVPAFTGTAIVAFAQSFALYPFLFFLALYLQDVLGHTPLETGVRMLPLTLLLLAVAPLSGRLTARLELRVPLVAGLVLIAVSVLLYGRLESSSDWTVLLPGLIVGGVAIGTISPALAAAMVAVLSVERSGLASGVNNLFRQVGIAAGVAGMGAIIAAQDSLVDGLHAVFPVAAAVALAGAAVAWPLLAGLRSPE